MMKILILLVYLFIAAVMDFRMHRVKNHFILIGLIIGIITGFDTINTYLGILLPLLLLILFYLRLLGAGDIKLLMVTGAFLGAHSLILLVPIVILVAGAMAVFLIIKNHFIKKIPYIFGQKIPIAPAIFIGVVLYSICNIRII